MLNKDYENKESAVGNMVVLSEQVHLDDDGHVLSRFLSNSVSLLDKSVTETIRWSHR